MKNIFNYIKKYGNKKFLEEPFNEVDNLVFASLSYVDFDIDKVNNLTIEEIGNNYFLSHTKKQINNNIIVYGFITKPLIKINESLNKELFNIAHTK